MREPLARPSADALRLGVGPILACAPRAASVLLRPAAGVAAAPVGAGPQRSGTRSTRAPARAATRRPSRRARGLERLAGQRGAAALPAPVVIPARDGRLQRFRAASRRCWRPRWRGASRRSRPTRRRASTIRRRPGASTSARSASTRPCAASAGIWYVDPYFRAPTHATSPTTAATSALALAAGRAGRDRPARPRRRARRGAPRARATRRPARLPPRARQRPVLRRVLRRDRPAGRDGEGRADEPRQPALQRRPRDPHGAGRQRLPPQLPDGGGRTRPPATRHASAATSAAARRTTRPRSTRSSATANYDIGHIVSAPTATAAASPQLGVRRPARREGAGLHRRSTRRSATASRSTTSPTRWATSSAARTPSTATSGNCAPPQPRLIGTRGRAGQRQLDPGLRRHLRRRQPAAQLRPVLLPAARSTTSTAYITSDDAGATEEGTRARRSPTTHPAVTAPADRTIPIRDAVHADRHRRPTPTRATTSSTCGSRTTRTAAAGHAARHADAQDPAGRCSAIFGTAADEDALQSPAPGQNIAARGRPRRARSPTRRRSPPTTPTPRRARAPAPTDVDCNSEVLPTAALRARPGRAATSA